MLNSWIKINFYFYAEVVWSKRIIAILMNNFAILLIFFWKARNYLKINALLKNIQFDNEFISICLFLFDVFFIAMA